MGDYDASIVMDGLLSGIPSIARADGAVNYILGFPTYDVAHEFIIDGYKRYTKETTYTYQWVSESGNPSPTGFPTRVELGLSSPGMCCHII